MVAYKYMRNPVFYIRKSYNSVNLFFQIYFKRGCVCVNRGGAEREERIPSRLCAVSAELDVGLNLTNREIMTRAKIKSQMLN